MKIISLGEMPDMLWHGTCDRCSTKVEATEDELQKNDDPIVKYVLTCPLPMCQVNIAMRRGSHPDRSAP
jgi:hypothetical protein